MTVSASEVEQLARSRGGACIGIGSGHRKHPTYLWECSAGHIWEARLDSVRQGTWCRRCNADRQKNTIEQMRALAVKSGGKCLSLTYADAHTKLRWQCAQGHIFEATPSHVSHGRWCRICGNKRAAEERRLPMNEIQALATAHSGKCLSETYAPGKKLKWQCRHGHVWEADIHNVKAGHWCPVCGHRRSGKKPLSIEEMRNMARSHRGQCLSTTYESTDSKLQWECSEGHTWFAIPSAVKKGHWCPECAGVKKHEIQDAQELAQSRGGECLSNEYNAAHSRLKWRCSEGHTWMAQYANVNFGRWCPECSAGLGERICRAYFEQMFGRAFPKARPDWLINSDGYQMELDGYCEDLRLAFEHQGRQHYRDIDFFYHEGQFAKRTSDDARKKTLCQQNGVTLIEVPQIPDSLPLTQIQQYIIGECAARGVALSETAASTKVELLKAYCPDARERLNLVQKAAMEHGGICLSPAYLGLRVSLRFRCAQGHEWKTTPSVVTKGHWCPECARSRQSRGRRLGLPAMQSLAASRGGRCLSTEYMNANAHLLWQCEQGHRWKATPHGIKSGHWCPVCANENRRRKEKNEEVE